MIANVDRYARSQIHIRRGRRGDGHDHQEQQAQDQCNSP